MTSTLRAIWLFHISIPSHFATLQCTKDIVCTVKTRNLQLIPIYSILEGTVSLVSLAFIVGTVKNHNFLCYVFNAYFDPIDITDVV